MTRVDCLRHGLTVENTRGIYHGTSDGTLTDEQRATLATVLFDASVYDAIYCSPLGRCRDTAQMLGVTRWTTEVRIGERNFGIFEGLSRADCEFRFPEEFSAFQRFDAHYRMPRGESRAQHLARTVAWLLVRSGVRRGAR